MKRSAAWSLLILLMLAVDLVDPTVPGVFSLHQRELHRHAELYVDGATRTPGSVVDLRCTRDGGHQPFVARMPRLAAPSTRRQVRDDRRAHAHPHARQILLAIALSGRSDTEDH